MKRKQILNFLALLLINFVVLVSAAFEDECLSAHNKYRRNHGVPELTLDKALQEKAQEHADYLASIDKFLHSHGPYGENIYMFSGRKRVIGSRPVNLWYNEINLYDFSTLKYQSGTGHFTQVIWKNSEYLGCAVSRNPETFKSYIVAVYYPRGNIVGAYENNVCELISE